VPSRSRIAANHSTRSPTVISARNSSLKLSEKKASVTASGPPRKTLMMALPARPVGLSGSCATATPEISAKMVEAVANLRIDEVMVSPGGAPERPSRRHEV
jgi:hypothetical protein